MLDAIEPKAFVVIKRNAFGKAPTLERALRICNEELGSTRKLDATVYAFDCPSKEVTTHCGIGLGVYWPVSATVFRFIAKL